MPRTRTPSDLKFLLNERAALAGAAASLEQQHQRLAGKVSAAESKLAACRKELAALEALQATCAQDLRAIELTIGAAYPAVNPDAVGPVRARSEPGVRNRGDLKRLVLELLERAAPEALSTSMLASAAAARFQWPVTTYEDRARAVRLVRYVLRYARERGLVTPLHSAVSGEPPGSWRWKDAAATGADLLELLAHDQGQDPLGAEVGGQRARGSHG